MLFSQDFSVSPCGLVLPSFISYALSRHSTRVSVRSHYHSGRFGCSFCVTVCTSFCACFRSCYRRGKSILYLHHQRPLSSAVLRSSMLSFPKQWYYYVDPSVSCCSPRISSLSASWLRWKYWNRYEVWISFVCSVSLLLYIFALTAFTF